MKTTSTKTARVFSTNHPSIQLMRWPRVSHITTVCYRYALLFFVAMLLSSVVQAADSICARVKIEIKQELTLERQAFDANMKINNGLDTIALEDVGVDVTFADENGDPVLASSDPNNQEAAFFIRIDSMTGIDDVGGNGIVPPASTADIHWLIIPAPGTGGVLPSGKLYFVGATLTYTLGGEDQVTEVSPDYIFVKPLPLMTLDYFLPADVYADDAFTPQIEPPVPFTLGVRILNNGSGAAHNLKIDSAQPKIIENEQGLIINFKIIGSNVDDQPTEPDLLIDFGDIEPNESAMGRWLMTTTLSGEFIEFTAEFSHADDLGGQLTSVIDAVNTHTLVHDVLVDVPGRDYVRDFLAQDAALRVYESNSVDTDVTDQSAGTTLQLAGQTGTQTWYTLDGPATAGFMYVKLADPHAGTRAITRALRSDGKALPLDNVWLSKERKADNSWNYFLNLFDANSTGDYTLSFDVPIIGPQPPVMQFIPDRSTYEGNQISFIVEASDPNGTTPALTAAPLPAGANYVDQGNGVGIFDWTPAVGQAGVYQIVFTASDGSLATSQMAQIFVYPVEDTDGDGMDDAWEQEYFGNLDRDGTGDFDGDGISDLQEFEDGTDPLGLDGPVAPMILSPWFDTEVSTLQPTLTLINGRHQRDSAILSYAFEVYADAALTTPLAGSGSVAESTDFTAWTVDSPLPDNRWAYWRARVFDGTLYSPWVYGRFFVNTANDAPGQPGLDYPANGVEVDTLTPLLVASNPRDPDEDVLTYEFEVFSDVGLNNLVASSGALAAGEGGRTPWVVPTGLTDDTPYYWQVTVTDEHGQSQSSTVGSFLVHTANTAPKPPVLVSPAEGDTLATLAANLVINNATDADGDPVSYLFELDTEPAFDSPGKVSSGPVAAGTSTTAWNVTGLADNTAYFWRAKSSDGGAESPWVVGSFRVSTANDSPSAVVNVNPADGAWRNRVKPWLRVSPATDVDGELPAYRFELYSDTALTTLVSEGTASGLPQWQVPVSLTDHSWYYWRARAEDATGGGPWSGTYSLYLNESEVAEAADLDGSGDVNSPDLGRMMSNWGVLSGGVTDLDRDGQTGLLDLEQLLRQLRGRTAVPWKEP